MHAPLSLVLVVLILDLLHRHLHPVLGEHDVLLLHVGFCLVANVLHDAVHDESDQSEDANDRHEDDYGEDGVFCHVVWNENLKIEVRAQ